MRRSGTRSVAVIGTRGYPSHYGGFETAVRHVAPRLADDGWEVTVYGRGGGTGAAVDVDDRIRRVDTGGIERRSLSTLSYGLTATLHAAAHRPDVALVMNVANGFWLPLLAARGIPTVVNVDGVEWERAKWGRVARAVFRVGAWCTARFGTALVVDARALGDFWRDRFGRSSTFIPYGGVHTEAGAAVNPFEPGSYVLFVARFVPENSVAEFFAAAVELARDHDVVLVGSSGYGGALDEAAARLDRDHDRIHWLGHVRDDALLHRLWREAGAYFHGHSVGGTNPALVQAMTSGSPTVARDTVFNREVLQDHGVFVPPEPAAIAAGLRRVLTDPLLRRRLGTGAEQRARDVYTWERVGREYSQLLERTRRADRS
ncbi:glycosyltransferase [Curtobacterium luteum]|uniref:glycosyltransferase n=1 Tax=Curtobacterium luteum TaxID=33881 RepID=UPI0038086BB8